MDLDLILVHAPSVYDFRQRGDLPLAYLSNSDSVHVSPIFEMPPVGLLSLAQQLRGRGLRVELFNLASKMLHEPQFDVPAFLERVRAPLFGVDLHWMAHCQGALALAALYRQIHPQSRTLLGGISASYYHRELGRRPEVDYVVRGYDTLEPLAALLAAGGDADALAGVPNLTWERDGELVVNPLRHAPAQYTASVDWSEVFHDAAGRRTRYSITIPQAGCEYDCKFCGGSRRFFRAHMGLPSGLAQRAPASLRAELGSVVASTSHRHTVTMIDFWHEHPKLFAAAGDAFATPQIGSVHYSLHRLPPLGQARAMARGVRAIMELSPDTHDRELARAAGRGKYGMDELEAWIDALLDDVYGFEIYFMLGLPGQDAASVRDTVAYCGRLLDRYRGRRVYPYLCPMVPLLDPGSEMFEAPERFGITLYHRSLEEHRRALTALSWVERINYRTAELDRRQLVELSYQAVLELSELKHRAGAMPERFFRAISSRIAATRALLGHIDAYQALTPGPARARARTALEQRVLAYNREQLAMVRSQQRPVDFGFSRSQWFDTEAAFSRALG